MTVSDNTFLTEGFGTFFEKLIEKKLNKPKQMATNVLESLSRVLEIGANFASAAASRKFKATLSTLPGVINF